MISYLPIIVCVLGGLFWFLATRPKLSDGMIAEMSKWSFVVGLIFTLWFYGGR